MRVQTDSSVLDVAPGGRADVDLDVVNTSPVIDGVTARIIGLDHALVQARPTLLPLFPDTSGRMTLTVDLPRSFPAGRHPVTVEVSSSAAAVEPQHVDLDVVVAPYADAELQLRPPVRRARRKGRFLVEAVNRGNVPLELTLRASDPDRRLRYELRPRTLTVEAGQTAVSALTVRAPRLLVGSDTDRPLTVSAQGEELSAEVAGTLRQRPLLPRGLLTVFVLMAIVGLWAGAFLLGLTKVFAGDPLTKTAPASYFASAPANPALAAAGGPAGALPKSGPLPPGVGGALAGTVTAASTGNGLGRIVVEALRTSRNGLQLVSSAATQTDGSYAIVGLLPGDYLLRFSAPGYRTAWYPSAAGQAAARPVSVGAARLVRNLDTRVGGLPATISGTVDPGDTLAVVRTSVVARPLEGPRTGSVVARAATDSAGRYTLRGLPAPGTYELSFTAAGYQPTTVVERVAGGQARLEPSVRLSAGDGTISGLVTAGGAPLGGVTVTTTVDGGDLATATPTQGSVGAFVLPRLPTPATYVLTFTRDGYGSQTVVVDLGPGQQRRDLRVRMVGGTGSVSGRVVGADGTGVGGATVSVGGMATPAQTTTLTTGDVGLFAISALPTPGSYTLTVTRDGYAPQTVPVVLRTDAPTAQVTVTLSRSVGSVGGRVTLPDGTPAVGAAVTVTDGAKTWTTTAVGAGPATSAGGYLVASLPPGSYAVTATLDGYAQRTALVTVRAGERTGQDITLGAGG